MGLFSIKCTLKESTDQTRLSVGGRSLVDERSNAAFAVVWSDRNGAKLAFPCLLFKSYFLRFSENLKCFQSLWLYSMTISRFRIQIHKALASAVPQSPPWVLTGMSAVCNQQALGAACGQHFGIQDRGKVLMKRGYYIYPLRRVSALCQTQRWV